MKNFKIKVCGITRQADAETAVRYGADLIGFIFYGKSPRFIQPDEVAAILEELDDKVETVGVFVNESVERIVKIANLLKLTYIQLSGDESNEEIAQLAESDLKVIKTIHIREESDIIKATKSLADIVHLDNADKNSYGGSGQTFDWELVSNLKLDNLMIAGGLNETNVEKAISLFKPMIVDVNSGVEDAPGIKSEAKLKRFIEVCENI